MVILMLVTIVAAVVVVVVVAVAVAVVVVVVVVVAAAVAVAVAAGDEKGHSSYCYCCGDPPPTPRESESTKGGGIHCCGTCLCVYNVWSFSQHCPALCLRYNRTEATLGVVRDVWLLGQTDFFIGHHTSAVSKAAYLLRYARMGLAATKTTYWPRWSGDNPGGFLAYVFGTSIDSKSFGTVKRARSAPRDEL